MHMQTEREYLVGLGLAKEGRGKFSNVAKEALTKAKAEGMTFKSTGPTRSSVPTVTSTETAGGGQTPVKTDPAFTAYLSPSDFRFPEAEYKAVGADGMTYGMRECCNHCRVSLVGHMCESPTILGGIAVVIRKR
jgi:hypothetical protein